MSAISTALRVIEWAKSPNGPPPMGDLQSAEQLAAPPAEVCSELRELWSAVAASLRIVPNHSHGNIGVGAVLLAAAGGVLQFAGLPRALIEDIDTRPNPNELVARHAIVAPLLRYLPPELIPVFLRHSPFTALLSRPVKGDYANVRATLNGLIGISDIRSAVVRHWVAPGRTTAELNWQASVLDRWRLGEEAQRQFVMDVYEAAFILYPDETLERILDARLAIRDAVATSDNELLTKALAVAEWWGALWNLERNDLDRLRERPYLGYQYHEGLGLFSLARRLTGGAAA